MRLRADQKLFLSYLTVVVAVVVALTLGVGNTLRTQLVEMTTAELRREVELARLVYPTLPGLSPDSAADWLGALAERRVTLIAPDGTVLGDSDVDPPLLHQMENHRQRPEVQRALAGEMGTDVRVSASVALEQLYVASLAGDGTVVRLSVPLREVDATVWRVQTGIFGVGLVALVLTGLLAYGFSLLVTRPLRQLVEVAREMARGDLSRRARSGDRDELGDLASALDTLAGELQRRLGQLEGERAEMQALIDSMMEGVVALGPDGSVRRANPAARRMFSLSTDPRGIAPEQVARRPSFLELVRAALQGRTVPPTELSDNERHMLATAQPLANGGAVLVFLDISELRRLEDVRRDFVANASHELKTPLTAIRGFSETLMDDHLPPELRRQFAATVKDNADRLQRIIDDLLDLSRIESGGWRVEPAIVSIPETAESAWAPFRAQAGARGAQLVLEIPPGCDYVEADPSALTQVLTNLFSNSLRYLPEGGHVAVRARWLPGPTFASVAHPYDGPGWIGISVEDDGAGIPAAHLPRIFERFYRADAARSRAEGGTGLGLSIVRHLVERHGGTIEAESQLGRGTTVRFTLPAPEEGGEE